MIHLHIRADKKVSEFSRHQLVAVQLRIQRKIQDLRGLSSFWNPLKKIAVPVQFVKKNLSALFGCPQYRILRIELSVWILKNVELTTRARTAQTKTVFNAGASI